jgi:opacity protein-like surface antigen
MKRVALAVLSLTLATPALGQSSSVSSSGSMPGRGAFGLGATISGVVGGDAATLATVQPGLQGSYFLDDPLRLTLNLGLSSESNVGTDFFLMGGIDFFLLKHNQFGGYLGGKAGFDIFSPSIGDSQGRFLMQIGGGAEYFVSRNFSVQLFEGLALRTNATAFALISTIGLNWWF